MEAELSQARGQLSKSSKDHKRLIEDERKARNKEVSLLLWVNEPGRNSDLVMLSK